MYFTPQASPAASLESTLQYFLSLSPPLFLPRLFLRLVVLPTSAGVVGRSRRGIPLRQVTLYSAARSLISYYCHVSPTRGAARARGRGRWNEKERERENESLLVRGTKRAKQTTERSSHTSRYTSLMVFVLVPCARTQNHSLVRDESKYILEISHTLLFPGSVCSLARSLSSFLSASLSLQP